MSKFGKLTWGRTESERKKGNIFGSCKALARLNVPRGLRSIFSVMSAYSGWQSVSINERGGKGVNSYQTSPKESGEGQDYPSFS